MKLSQKHFYRKMSFTMIKLCIACFVIFATSSNASLCPEVCKCDDENLVVKCGLIGKAKKYKYKRIYRNYPLRVMLFTTYEINKKLQMFMLITMVTRLNPTLCLP